MKPGPANITKILLASSPLDLAPTRLRDLISAIVLDKEWEESKTIAAEKAEKWLSQVERRLLREKNSLVELGIPVRIEFNDSSPEYIQGACFVEPSDDTETRAMKERRLLSEPLYKAICDISDQQFEELCGKVLELLGVRKPSVTRKSADDGIDFFGKLRLKHIMPTELTPTIQQQLDTWIVGQAKQYVDSKAGTPEVRDLVGAIALGRAGAFGGEFGPIEQGHIRVADPVFAMLVTAGSFSANAWNLLKRSGVVGVDGQMLAAYLADKNIGQNANGDFEKSEFDRWLSS